LLRYESRLDADIRVVILPEGMDPDEVVQEDPDAWPRLLEKAVPIVHYVLDRLSESRDLEDPKAKAEVARQVLPLIEDVVDPVEREAYRQHLARRLRVDERALMGWRRAPAGRGASVRPAMGTGRAREVESRVKPHDPPSERFCLALLLERPDLLYRVDRQFQRLEMERLAEQDFTSAERRYIFRMVREALAQDVEEPEAYWRARLEEPLLEATEGLLEELERVSSMVRLELEQPKVMDEVTARFLQLRKRRLDDRLRNLQFVLQSVGEGELDEADPEMDPIGLQREVQRYALLKARLEQALARRHGSASRALAGLEW
jgi:DNA primase